MEAYGMLASSVQAGLSEKNSRTIGWGALRHWALVALPDTTRKNEGCLERAGTKKHQQRELFGQSTPDKNNPCIVKKHQR